MFNICVLLRPCSNNLLFFSKNVLVADDLYSVLSQDYFRYIYMAVYSLGSVVVVMSYPVGWLLIKCKARTI